MTANDVSVAVCSRSFSRNRLLRAELESRYGDVQFNDAGLQLTGQTLVEFLDGKSHAIVALERITGDVLAAVPRLRVISKYGVGMDGLDFPALARRNVKLGWTGGVNKRAVAEMVICFAISLLRHISAANLNVRSGEWRQLVGNELSQCTVGIIGCGHVGKEVGRLFRAFGCRVLSCDVLDFPDYYQETGVEPVALEKLLAAAKIVSLHLPLTSQTRLILDDDRLSLMRPDAILLNTARGGLVDEAALKIRLMTNKLAAAGFDVFAVEPPDDRELLELPNFLATPHIGGSSEEAILAMGRAAIDGLETATVPAPGDGRWPL